MIRLYNYSCADCKLIWEGARPQRGSRCKSCAVRRANIIRTDPTKTVCSKCGGEKSYQADFCRGCRNQTGENNAMFGKAQPHLTEMNLGRKSDEHWNWKGGVPRKRDGKSQQWGVNVRKAGECAICTSRIGLEAHHLEAHNSNEDMRWDTGNGVCLCKVCHIGLHKMYGFGDNTSEQYLEFKEAYNARN